MPEGSAHADWYNTPVRILYRQCNEAVKKMNAELVRTAQDRKFRFQTHKLFHDRTEERGEDDSKWNYYSDDDDVLLYVDGEKHVMANIEVCPYFTSPAY